LPDVEDINRDNTMKLLHYECCIDVQPNMAIGKNYITDIRNTQVTLPNGQVTDARWIQFKISVYHS
jgi:cell surface protein SprA